MRPRNPPMGSSLISARLVRKLTDWRTVTSTWVAAAGGELKLKLTLSPGVTTFLFALLEVNLAARDPAIETSGQSGIWSQQKRKPSFSFSQRGHGDLYSVNIEFVISG